MTEHPLHTEQELLYCIAEGDEAAFTMFFNTWYPLLSTLVQRMTRSELDYTMRMQQFFDHYLKGAPAPKWMTEGIPAALKRY